MISSRSFDQTLYNRLKVIVSIQKLLSKLTNNNLTEIGTKIFFQKEIFNSQLEISILAQCFKEESDFHPKNIENLADLFIFLVDKSDSSNYFNLLRKYAVLCIRMHDKIRSSFLFFLRTLIKKLLLLI